MITETVLPVEMPLSDGFFQMAYANHGNRFAFAYWHPDGKGRLMAGQIDGATVTVGAWVVMPEFPQSLWFLDHDHLLAVSGYVVTGGTDYPEDYGSFHGFKTFLRTWTIAPSMAVTATDVILATNATWGSWVFVNTNGDISAFSGDQGHLDTEHVTNGTFSHADSLSGGEKVFTTSTDPLPSGAVPVKVGVNDWLFKIAAIQGFGSLVAGATSWSPNAYPNTFPPGDASSAAYPMQPSASNFLPGRVLWNEYVNDTGVTTAICDLDVATGTRLATWTMPPGGAFIQGAELTTDGQAVLAYTDESNNYYVDVDAFGTKEQWTPAPDVYPLLFGFGASNVIVLTPSNHYGDGTPSALYLLTWSNVMLAPEMSGDLLNVGRMFNEPGN